jgi:enterochelin esterase family protein
VSNKNITFAPHLFTDTNNIHQIIMKNKSLNILFIALMVVCAGCCPKAKQVIEPSQVIVTSYPSSIGEAGVAVYLPEGYTRLEQDYPVLYLLHGSGDDEAGWLTKGRAKAILDSLITNNLCQPMIVVMPNGYLEQTGKYYTPESRLWMESTFEENFSQLIAWTEAHFRTLTDKQHRAIAGLSMGGFHTMHTAALLNQSFDYVGIFSALYVPHTRQLHSERSIEMSALTLSDKPTYQQTEALLAQQFANPPQLYWIACGVDDFLYEDNVVYRQYLDEKQYPYEYHESAGGHSWENWMDYLRIFAQRLF